VVGVTNPYSHNFCFLVRSRYFFFQVALQFYSLGRVDPVPDPLLLRKSSSASNRTQTSGSVARICCPKKGRTNSLLKYNRCFEGTFCLLLQDEIISITRFQHQSKSSRCPDRDSIQASAGYKTEALPLETTCCVSSSLPLPPSFRVFSLSPTDIRFRCGPQ
jgi:hypothetical protein